MSRRLKHLSDDHYIAIANVAIRASQMEHHVEKTIEVALRNQPKTAEYLLKNLNTDRIIGVLKAILLDAAPDEEPRIENLIKTISDVRTDRNELLHWTWMPGLKPDTAIHATHRPFRDFRWAEKTASQIQAVADEAETVTSGLMNWQGVSECPAEGQETIAR